MCYVYACLESGGLYKTPDPVADIKKKTIGVFETWLERVRQWLLRSFLKVGTECDG
jgi:hypothetical protein